MYVWTYFACFYITWKFYDEITYSIHTLHQYIVHTYISIYWASDIAYNWIQHDHLLYLSLVFTAVQHLPAVLPGQPHAQENHPATHAERYVVCGAARGHFIRSGTTNTHTYIHTYVHISSIHSFIHAYSSFCYHAYTCSYRTVENRLNTFELIFTFYFI